MTFSGTKRRGVVSGAAVLCRVVDGAVKWTPN